MIYSTHEVLIDLGRLFFMPPLLLSNSGAGHHQSIAFHLFDHGLAEPIPADWVAEVHWGTLDGSGGGSYTQIDEVDAYSIETNVVTVELSPEIMGNRDPVLVSVTVHNADDTKAVCTPSLKLCIRQIDLIDIDKSEVCDPYAYARITGTTEAESTIELTVAGICETFVTEISLEYVLRPSDENESVFVPVEIGEYDLVNGHVYALTIPVSTDYLYRAVLNYAKPDRTAQTFEGQWSYAPCSVCGGIHSHEKTTVLKTDGGDTIEFNYCRAAE